MQTIDGQNSQKDYLGPANRTWAIFLISVLGLFLEMLFIRWISTEVRIFAYLQNTVLVVCFMGLGVGCFTSRQPIEMRQMLLPLFILVLIFAIPFTRTEFARISEMLSVLEDLEIWSNYPSTSIWQTILYMVMGLFFTYFLMVMIVDIFIPIGRLLGRLMDDHPNTIWAYSGNVAGSLVGIWLFVLMSVLYQPPVTWFVAMGLLTAFFLDKRNWALKVNLTLLIGIIALSWFAGKDFCFIDDVWSPYQKLTIRESDHRKGMLGKYTVFVNNTGYQTISDVSDSNAQSNPKLYPLEMRGLSQYDIPLLLHPNPQSYLIVGAGAGNDAAGGLRHEVKQITAVEIDPAIISLGNRYHPERPYSSPIVQVVEDDARSFFATCKKRYDVISFGLLDSHTTTAMTNARLDHYVYTRESLTHAKSLLADGGILVLTFEAQRKYIADRMAKSLQEVFDEKPIFFRIPVNYYNPGGVMFIAGDLETVKKQIAKNGKLTLLIEKWKKNYPLFLTYTTKIATDDWPYIYLKKPSIPFIYFLLAALMVVLLIRCYRRWQVYGLISKWKRSH
jgi:spermidine synthase